MLEEMQKRVPNEDIGVVDLNIWRGFESEPPLYLDRIDVMDEFSEG